MDRSFWLFCLSSCSGLFKAVHVQRGRAGCSRRWLYFKNGFKRFQFVLSSFCSPESCSLLHVFMDVLACVR